jgi:hypothetical protein
VSYPYDRVFGEYRSPYAITIASAARRLDEALESDDWDLVTEAAALLRYRPAAEYATRLPTDAELEQVHESLTEVVDR